MARFTTKSQWIISALSILAIAWVGYSCTVQDRDASAQGNFDRVVETFTIVPGSFTLRTQGDPTIEIFDGTTQYTLIDDALLTVTKSGESSTTNFQLQANDTIIERPDSGGGVITIIRDF